MLEVLFSESAAGSLKAGVGRSAALGGSAGSVAIVAADEAGHPLPPEETQRLLRDYQAREERRWAEAVPLEGDTRDILPFSLGLSMGPIDEAGIGPQREAVLEQLFRIFPQGRQTAAEMTASCRQRLNTLLARAVHEPVRIWVDRTPDAACGLRWLLEQLRPLGLETLALQLVELPALRPHQEGGLVLQVLGELHPSQWGRLARQARCLPAGEAAALAAQWRQLQRENAPLRAVVNGLLVSAAEDLYDPFLRRVLEELEDTFHEADLIGRTLGRFPLGFSDVWLDGRLERWIAQGELAVVTPPDPDAPRYHRMLRKTEG